MLTLHECDVLKKIDLIASMEFAEAGSVSNKFTVDWELNNYRSYDGHKMYLVLEPQSVLIPTSATITNPHESVILVAHGIQFSRDQRKGHPQFITYLRYPEEQDDTQPRAIPKEVVHEINGIPDKYITFEVWSNNLSALFLAAANTQPYSDIDLVFSLYIMKSKH